MKNMGLNEIRKAFLDFYEAKGHTVSASYPLVPQADKSLLLVNAGMQPLKNYFTGVEVPPNTKMATCQKCIRTGDIENVGVTARHATFFEMLGNFSFGDYFKQGSLELGWDFITNVLEMPVDLLWPSVYHEDEEAFAIWRDVIGIPEEKITRLGKKDNFWEIGTGPCGPCSEIYFDRGEAYGCGDEKCAPGCDCERFLEFWNHVFTQYNRDENGNYTELEKKNIDTGMGLERIACLMQGVDSIFEVDTIKTIVDKVVSMTAVTYGKGLKSDVSIRIITDHVKAVTFMVGDGILPNNEGRGYVLRRLLRRASRHIKMLGVSKPALTEVVDAVIESYGVSYPNLVERADYIKRVIQIEEERFQSTIDQGLGILDAFIKQAKEANQTVLGGDKAFMLYDTYGFPVELTMEILEEEKMTVDEEGYQAEMEAQRKRARTARGSGDELGWATDAVAELPAHIVSTFNGYNQLTESSTVLALLTDEIIEEAIEGMEVSFVLDQTPFYPEGGGQVGDTGRLYAEGFEAMISGTHKAVGGRIVLSGMITKGHVKVGAKVTCEVSRLKRMATTRNHSATHLLHKALKEVLGDHVEQAGSLVNPERLRFDFSHFEAMTPAQVLKVEQLVNAQILSALETLAEEMPINIAKAKGAMALFGEKYGDTVRVVTMGDYSIELCGGTHVKNTSEIGLFKILSEAGVAAGVRRIEATTGDNVYKMLCDLEEKLYKLSDLLKTSVPEVENKVQSVLTEYKNVVKENEQLKNKLAKGNLDSIISSMQKVGNYEVVTATFHAMDMNTLRNLGDQLKGMWENSVVVLANIVSDDKVELLAMVSDAAVIKGAHAGNIIKTVAMATGGGGGGKPQMAQAGGKDASKVAEALQKVYALLS